jgi:hypothetical protein
MRNTGRTLLKTISIYAPPTYRDEDTELPAGRSSDYRSQYDERLGSLTTKLVSSLRLITVQAHAPLRHSLGTRRTTSSLLLLRRHYQPVGRWWPPTPRCGICS